jgi:hypothetical protein
MYRGRFGVDLISSYNLTGIAPPLQKINGFGAGFLKRSEDR